jgi:type III restriction enzyme
MSLENTIRSICDRLSLREPQAESLRRLHSAIDEVPALRNPKAMLEALQEQFPTLTDFERDFPSLCFALATGVGKTRLMGAFISYLHAAYGYQHFFVLAPNLTIYDHLRQANRRLLAGLAQIRVQRHRRIR